MSIFRSIFIFDIEWIPNDFCVNFWRSNKLLHWQARKLYCLCGLAPRCLSSFFLASALIYAPLCQNFSTIHNSLKCISFHASSSHFRAAGSFDLLSQGSWKLYWNCVQCLANMKRAEIEPSHATAWVNASQEFTRVRPLSTLQLLAYKWIWPIKETKSWLAKRLIRRLGKISTNSVRAHWR